MDNNLEVVASPDFVVVINHEMGGASAGFVVTVTNIGFTVISSTSDANDAGADMTDSEIKIAYENNPNTNAFQDADQTKLAGIESGAAQDQTGAEIKTRYELEADTNAFDDAAVSKLAAIEASATADQTNAEIRTAVGAATDSNVFQDADASKLDGIEASATADQSNAEIRTAVEAASDSNVFTDGDHSKLNAIEAAADVTDAGNVATAGAVMDSDISAGEGFLRKSGAGTYVAVKTNLGSAANPGTGDDNTAGYGIGSRWINTTLDKEFVCLDITTGAAVWTETTGGGGGMSDAEVKTAYENNANTNEFDDAEQSKLAAIEASADVTDAGNVAAAGAVMDSDVSEGEGFLRKTGAGAYEAIKSNIGATVDPDANDDTGDGYVVGSIWINTTGDAVFQCVDNTSTAAVWKNLSAGAAGGETNTASNGGGAGVGVWDAKSGVDLIFRNLVAASSRITVSLDDPNNEIDLDVAVASATVAGAVELATITEVNTGSDTTRAITPAGLAGSALQTKVDGVEASATADQSDPEIATAYGNEVGQVSAGEITAGTETTLRTYAPDDIVAFIDEHGGGGGGKSPTRSILTLSSSEASITIPAGCTWFRFQSSPITVSDTSGSPYCNMEHGAAVIQKFSGTEELLSSTLSLNVQTDTGAIALTGASGGTTVRTLAGIVWAPRDGTKKTIAHGYGLAHGTPEGRKRLFLADTAEDDDELFFRISVGTFTGTIEIEWFYDGGAVTEVNPFTDDHTLALTDSENIVEIDKATANVLTIPLNSSVAFPIGTIITITQAGVGTTSITAATSVTLNGVSAGSGDMTGEFAGVSLYKSETDVWIVQGSIGAVA